MKVIVVSQYIMIEGLVPQVFARTSVTTVVVTTKVYNVAVALYIFCTILINQSMLLNVHQ